MNTLVGDVHVVNVLNPIDPNAKKDIRRVRYEPELRILDFVQARKARGEDIEVILNDEIVTDWTRPVLPGDWVYVVPVVHEPISTFLAITLATWASSAGIGTAAIGTAIGLASTAITGAMVGIGVSMVGGVIMNAIAPSPGMPSPRPEESPSYSWNPAYNPENEGGAIPVVYGNVLVTPTIIGRYIEIDDDGDQWAHVLLCVHQGETNNVPTADDILANDEPLNHFDDYTVKATDGSLDPDTTQFDKFQKLHQMRSFSKFLEEAVIDTNIFTLLHLNGSNGSTTITDDSSYGYTWACQSGAVLTTAGEKFGSACLDVTGAGDYISTTDHEAMWLFEDADDSWDKEKWFKTPDNTQDSGIMGQVLTYGASYTLYWSLLYVGGNLEFNYWKDTGATETIYWNVSSAWTPTDDVWYHIRVAHDVVDGTRYVKIWVNGSILTTGTETTTPIDAPTGFTADVGMIGNAYRNESGTPTLYDGKCYIDDVRIARKQLLYEWEDTFTIPTGEVDDGSNAEEYTTKGVVDEATFIFDCPLGLYKMNDNAEMQTLSVDLRVEYRKVGESTWSSEDLTVSGKSRYPVRKQLNIAFGERAEYEFQVYRLTPVHTDTRKQSRLYWIVVDEILDEFVHYKGLQCVQVAVKAQDSLSGNIPVFKVECNRSEISVPIYGTVDATNPAYAALDMFTNAYYGPGVTSTRFDQDAFEDWRDWCAGTVGGYTRAQINMIFDQEHDLDRAIQFVENVGRAKIVTKGTKISAVIDKPTTPGALYTAGNIVKNSFILTTLPQSERVDAVEISYKDKDKNWESVTAPPAFASYYNTLTRPPRVARMFLPGINNEEQAIREAILKMQQSEALKRACEFGSGANAIRSVVGDCFYFQHDGNMFTAGGRIKWDVDNSTTVYIDQAVTLDSSVAAAGYVLMVHKADTDTLVEEDIDSPLDTETKTLTLDAAITVSRRDVYMIARKTEEKVAYRLTTVSRQFDQAAKKQQFKLKGALYTESAYFNADYDGGAVGI
jgi:hypothetical protein